MFIRKTWPSAVTGEALSSETVAPDGSISGRRYGVASRSKMRPGLAGTTRVTRVWVASLMGRVLHPGARHGRSRGACDATGAVDWWLTGLSRYRGPVMWPASQRPTP